ncbi:hypothetical protein TKK_0018357 [Trichogramma kaykai]
MEQRQLPPNSARRGHQHHPRNVGRRRPPIILGSGANATTTTSSSTTAASNTGSGGPAQCGPVPVDTRQQFLLNATTTSSNVVSSGFVGGPAQCGPLETEKNDTITIESSRCTTRSAAADVPADRKAQQQPRQQRPDSRGQVPSSVLSSPEDKDDNDNDNDYGDLTKSSPISRSSTKSSSSDNDKSGVSSPVLEHADARDRGDGNSDEETSPYVEEDPEFSELSKLRCSSVCTEVVAAKEARRSKRCADYPGFAFGISMFASDTMMKFSLIKNELQNIKNSQMKRVRNLNLYLKNNLSHC